MSAIPEPKIDFISEFHYKSCHHIIDTSYHYCRSTIAEVEQLLENRTLKTGRKKSNYYRISNF